MTIRIIKMIQNIKAALRKKTRPKGGSPSGRPAITGERATWNNSGCGNLYKHMKILYI